MGFWLAFHTLHICRHCDVGQAGGEPFYRGRSAFPFCAQCAARIGFHPPPEGVRPETVPPMTEDAALISPLARLNRARIAGELARKGLTRFEL